MRKQERAATKTRRLRFGQAEHQLHGDRRVHCRSSGAQDFVPRVDRQRIRRGDHEPTTLDRAFVGPSGRSLGRLILRCCTDASEARQYNDDATRLSARLLESHPRLRAATERRL